MKYSIKLEKRKSKTLKLIFNKLNSNMKNSKLFNPLFDTEKSYTARVSETLNFNIQKELQIKSNYREYENLTNNLQLTEVLVGRAGKPPIKALADLSQRVCLPIIKKD